MQQNEMKTIIDNYIKSYNSFDIDGMAQNMHQDVFFQNISNDEVNMSSQGITEFLAAANQAKNLFKSRCQTVTKYQFFDNSAQIDIDYNGILKMDIPNGPQAGETLKLKGKSEFEFKDGLIITLRDIS